MIFCSDHYRIIRPPCTQWKQSTWIRGTGKACWCNLVKIWLVLCHYQSWVTPGPINYRTWSFPLNGLCTCGPEWLKLLVRHWFEPSGSQNLESPRSQPTSTIRNRLSFFQKSMDFNLISLVFNFVFVFSKFFGFQFFS